MILFLDVAAVNRIGMLLLVLEGQIDGAFVGKDVDVAAAVQGLVDDAQGRHGPRGFERSVHQHEGERF